MNILVVDDDVNVTDSLDMFLSESHNVTCFNDPLEALEQYKNDQNFDVVITDFLMPQLRGDDLIKLIYELNPEQCFVVISGFFTKSFVDILKKSNAYIKMLDKPINIASLESNLKTIENLRQ